MFPTERLCWRNRVKSRRTMRCFVQLWGKTYTSSILFSDFVDSHSGYGGQSFSNDGYGSYGNDYNGGYGSSEVGSYGSMHNDASSYDMPFGGAGSMYGNTGYGSAGGYVNPQESMKFNSPFFYEQQGVYSPPNNRKPNYPPTSYPRAHRLPNKFLQTQGRNPNEYYFLNQGSNFSNNNNNAMSNYNANNAYDSGSINSKEIPSTSNQNQPSTPNQLYFTGLTGNTESPNGGHTESDSSETKFSQPVYNPSSYAEYVLSQQQSSQQSNFAKNSSEQFSQAYNPDTSTQTATTPGIDTQATRMHSTYQPYPSNVHNPYSVSQSSNSFNNIPHHQSPSDYNMMKSRFPHMKINNGFEQAFKQQNPFHNGNSYKNPWILDPYTTLNNDYSQQPMRHRNTAPFYQSPALPEYNRVNQNFNNEAMRNNNPQASYNPYEGINQNNFKQKNNDAYAPSGSSYSSNSYSNSYTPQSQFQNSGVPSYSPEGPSIKNTNINDISKYNEKFDQSFNPNMYSSKANSVAPNTYNPSGVSAPYSSNIPNSDHVTQNTPAHNNYFDTNNKNLDDNSYQNNPSYNYGDPPNYSPKMHSTDSGLTSSKEQNRPDSISSQGNFGSYVGIDSPNAYNQLINNYPSYTENDYSKNSQLNSPQSNYQFQSLSNNGYQSYNNSSPSSKAVSSSLSDQTDTPASFSYGFRHQGSQSQPTYTGSYYSGSVDNVQYSPQDGMQYQQQDSFSPLLDMQSSSPSVTKNQADIQSPISPAFQGYDPKLDEMEQHAQTSASSIINVYTNSPNSKEAQKGQTFSFIDTGALDSSPSAYYAHPDSGAKNGYSNVDMQVVQGPSFSHDPNEPLQTSLDAYSPPHPVYRPSPSSQNTVYKEAVTVNDQLYKEATNLNNDIKGKTR